VSHGRPLNIGVVCGEHSGDRLGSGLIKEIQKNSDVNLFGIGGPQLEELGFKSEFNFSEINIMGLVEPLLNYRKLNNLRNSLIKLFIDKKIDYFIGIDSPDFNMGIHKALKKNHNNKNVQVVSPSVWGWRQNRIKSIKKNIDLTMCLFNFENEFYKEANHKSLHLGHPFSDLYKLNKYNVLKKYQLNEEKKFISIIPGSRKSEIHYMLPTFIEFIEEHSKHNKEYEYLLPVADEALMEQIQKLLSKLNLPIVIEEKAMQDFLSISDIAIVTSGTATLESAILGCSPIICYKTGFINYSIISRMLRVDNIGLPNLLLGKKYFNELLQDNCTQETIHKSFNETLSLVKDSNNIAETLRKALKGIGYSRAAKEIVSI
tara:strand:- start:10293 stop:11414 length:1122 start_codon:yes stop_codon:yes gene_type:complete